MPPLLADFIHARGCKLKCEKFLTLPSGMLYSKCIGFIKKVLKEKCPTVCISANDRKIQNRPAKVL